LSMRFEISAGGTNSKFLEGSGSCALTAGLDISEVIKSTNQQKYSQGFSLSNVHLSSRDLTGSGSLRSSADGVFSAGVFSASSALTKSETLLITGEFEITNSIANSDDIHPSDSQDSSAKRLRSELPEPSADLHNSMCTETKIIGASDGFGESKILEPPSSVLASKVLAASLRLERSLAQLLSGQLENSLNPQVTALVASVFFGGSVHFAATRDLTHSHSHSSHTFRETLLAITSDLGRTEIRAQSQLRPDRSQGFLESSALKSTESLLPREAATFGSSSRTLNRTGLISAIIAMLALLIAVALFVLLLVRRRKTSATESDCAVDIEPESHEFGAVTVVSVDDGDLSFESQDQVLSNDDESDFRLASEDFEEVTRL